MRVQHLSYRERSLLICAALFVSLAGLYTLYDRALSARHASMERLQKADAIHAALLRLPERGEIRAGNDLPLARRLTEAAAAHAIPINRLDPLGDAIAVLINEVAFTSVLDWIESLSASGAAVLSLDIGRSPEPGIVSGNFVWGTSP